MPEFAELWDFIVKRSHDACIPVVQDRTELEHVFNLLLGCNSYLEIGTAEGNSLFVLAQAMPKGSEIAYVDFGEPHTTTHRNAVLDRLANYKITAVHGDSNDFKTRQKVFNCKTPPQLFYDAILIDAGHDSMNAAIDAYHYGVLAQKYIIFHDIQLPEVRRAYDWYCRQRPECRNYTVINSETYGFGIIEVKNG